MIDDILNLDGVSVLNKNTQQTVQGGNYYYDCDNMGSECWESVH